MVCSRCGKAKQWVGTMRTCVNPKCDLFKAGVAFNQGPRIANENPQNYKETTWGWIKISEA